jgi:hypothetical protein
MDWFDTSNCAFHGMSDAKSQHWRYCFLLMWLAAKVCRRCIDSRVFSWISTDGGQAVDFHCHDKSREAAEIQGTFLVATMRNSDLSSLSKKPGFGMSVLGACKVPLMLCQGAQGADFAKPGFFCNSSDACSDLRKLVSPASREDSKLRTGKPPMCRWP